MIDSEDPQIHILGLVTGILRKTKPGNMPCIIKVQNGFAPKANKSSYIGRPTQLRAGKDLSLSKKLLECMG